MKRTFPWRSARLRPAGLACHATISAAELFGRVCRSTLCIFFAHPAVLWRGLGVLGASSECFRPPSPFFVRARAHEALGIVHYHTHCESSEGQLRLTRGCDTFCSRSRLCVFVQRGCGRLFESQRAVLPAVARTPHPNPCPRLGLGSTPAKPSSNVVKRRYSINRLCRRLAPLVRRRKSWNRHI